MLCIKCIYYAQYVMISYIACIGCARLKEDKKWTFSEDLAFKNLTARYS